MDEEVTYEEVVEWFRLLQWLPDLLPPAPDVPSPEDIAMRASGSSVCAKCGNHAWYALTAATDKGTRWVDLCETCRRWLLAGLDKDPNAWNQ